MINYENMKQTGRASKCKFGIFEEQNIGNQNGIFYLCWTLLSVLTVNLNAMNKCVVSLKGRTTAALKIRVFCLVTTLVGLDKFCGQNFEQNKRFLR